MKNITNYVVIDLFQIFADYMTYQFLKLETGTVMVKHFCNTIT